MLLTLSFTAIVNVPSFENYDYDLSFAVSL